MGFIPDSVYLHVAILVVCFGVLAKSADFLVDGAVGVAHRLRLPKVIIGIVLVSFMTTAPEFTVSIISALSGKPEIALGNAVGSVITDDALALALGILVAPAAIAVDSKLLKTTGLFLIAVDLLSFLLSLNGTVSRGEGIVLLLLLAGYLTVLVVVQKRRPREAVLEAEEHYHPTSTHGHILRLLAGVVGVLVASDFLVNSAEYVARFAGVSPAVIGLTLVALGTSVPEIATCIVAARKGHGDLAFGDIIGADILNILWIVGASATANPLVVGRKVTSFSFPAMIVVVLVMLVLARIGFRFERWKGAVLLVLYIAYIAATIALFYA